MKTKIYIRTDGNAQMGLGHIIRCLALAKMLEREFSIAFYCKDIPHSIENEIGGNKFGVFRIKEEGDFLNKIEYGQIVVIDGYHFNTSYQKQIIGKGAKLVCIDDLHDREFYADLIINHAPGVTSEDYKAQTYTEFALGLKYALLRAAFLEQSIKPKQQNKIEKILICFGGSDNKNLTYDVLSVVKEFEGFVKIIVITGSKYLFLDKLKTILLQDERIFHYHALDETQMLSLFCETNLAVVPASGIVLEALACGAVVISGTYVDNQKLMFNGLLSINAIISANEFDATSLRLAIKDINGYIVGGEMLFDNKVKDRIINQFIKLTHAK